MVYNQGECSYGLSNIDKRHENERRQESDYSDLEDESKRVVQNEDKQQNGERLYWDGEKYVEKKDLKEYNPFK